MTLLNETTEFLLQSGKTGSDVRFVRTKDQCGTWEEFTKIADFDYDNGYGGNKISTSLRIVGDNWWLERCEYDGIEWWEFKTLPVQPVEVSPLTDVLKV